MLGRSHCLILGLSAAHLVALGFAACFAAGLGEPLTTGGAIDQVARYIALNSAHVQKGWSRIDRRRLANSRKIFAREPGLVPVAFELNGASPRPDGSLKLRIPLQGSLQSPAWSPDRKSIVFTRFRNGYNEGPADVYILNLETNTLRSLLADGSDNVTQPGSTWNSRTNKIAFSSDRDGHEEIWTVNAHGQGEPQKITGRSSRAAYEPSFAPDGQSLVFESRDVGSEGPGRITLFEIGSKHYTDITAVDEDCRQPNWSPRGDYIVYQKQLGGQWDLWLYEVKSRQHRLLTVGLAGDKTDASFSPGGRFVVYSGRAPENDEVSGAGDESILALPITGGQPVPITRYPGYHGAPSWSPDRAYVAAETSTHSPGEIGTELIIIRLQSNVVRQLSE
jgi:TolB protein